MPKRRRPPTDAVPVTGEVMPQEVVENPPAASRGALALAQDPPPERRQPMRSTMGRPTKYTPDMIRSIDLMIADKKITTVAGILCALNISRDTLYNWAKKYPDFSDAIERGRVAMIHDVERSVRAGTTNHAAGAFLLKNWAPNDYKDSRHLEHSGEIKQTVDIDFTGYDEDDDAIDGEFEEIQFDD